MRKDFKIRTVIAALVMALLTQSAYAQQGQGQGLGNRKTSKQQASGNSAEDAANKKALDADYKNALKNIPAVTEKPDPWKSMR